MKKRKGEEMRRSVNVTKIEPEYDLRGLYTGACGCLNERGTWLSDALALGLSGLLGMLPACCRLLYDILTFEEHELPATRCRAMSVRGRRQQELTPQMRPELVFPAEVLLAMGASDPRTTVLGEVVVAA